MGLYGPRGGGLAVGPGLHANNDGGVGGDGLRVEDPIDALFDFDFTALSLGAHTSTSFAAATAIGNVRGLAFARASASTVQTSDSALDPTPGVDDACVGNRGTDPTKRGLVLQHRVLQIIGVTPPGAGTNGPRDLSTSDWQPGSTVVTTPAFAAGPDGVTPGVGCTRSNVTSGGYSRFAPISGQGGSRSCLSSWQRSTTSSDMMQIMNDGSISATSKATVRAASTTWGRLVTLRGTLALADMAVCDARDFSACGGQTARARDVLTDYVQFESGNYPTEAIPLSLTYRQDDRVTYPIGSELIASNGQLKFYAKASTKHASTDQSYYDDGGSSSPSLGWFLFSWGAANVNYAYVKDSDKKLYVKIAGGTEVHSTNALTWSQYDVVEVYVAVGNNIASVAKYKVNGGSWTDLVLATIPNAPAPGSGAVGVLHNVAPSGSPFNTNDHGQLPCWLHHLTIYTTTTSPAGI